MTTVSDSFTSRDLADVRIGWNRFRPTAILSTAFFESFGIQMPSFSVTYLKIVDTHRSTGWSLLDCALAKRAKRRESSCIQRKGVRQQNGLFADGFFYKLKRLGASPAARLLSGRVHALVSPP